MPDPAAASPTPPMPGAAGAPGSAPPSPPMGTSAATQPTPNRGLEVSGQQKLGLIIRGLEQVLPLVGASSEMGKDVLSALRMLAKHVPPGSVTPASEANQIQQMATRNTQNGQQMAQLRQQLQAQGAAPGAAGGAPPGAA